VPPVHNLSVVSRFSPTRTVDDSMSVEQTRAPGPTPTRSLAQPPWCLGPLEQDIQKRALRLGGCAVSPYGEPTGRPPRGAGCGRSGV